jgi:hypothetical protein
MKRKNQKLLSVRHSLIILNGLFLTLLFMLGIALLISVITVLK